VDTYLGEVKWFAFNFAPQYFAPCDGALLSISQNSALFSLLGTTFGGDGQNTFALPQIASNAGLNPCMAIQGVYPQRS
jgi:microcystin-dependent protein